MDTALTAADFGAGWRGTLVFGELERASAGLTSWTDETRFSAFASITDEEAFAFGLRRLGPFARFLVMCVSSAPVSAGPAG